MVVSDDVILELVVPTEARAGLPAWSLGQINRGFRYPGRGCGQVGLLQHRRGLSRGRPLGDEINSVGVYTINGTWFCTGAMVNNTAEDETPYFLTANHCGISHQQRSGRGHLLELPEPGLRPAGRRLAWTSSAAASTYPGQRGHQRFLPGAESTIL